MLQISTPIYMVHLHGTPTYKLAKFLLKFLTPSTANEFTVIDSFHILKIAFVYTMMTVFLCLTSYLGHKYNKGRRKSSKFLKTANFQ